MSKRILILFVVCVCGVGAWWQWHRVTPQAHSVVPVSAHIHTVSRSTVAAATSSVSKVSPPKSTLHTASSVEKLYQTQRFHFSLLYPDSLQVQEQISPEGTLTVGFENKDARDPRGFQVYVQPYDLTEVTPARFQADEPSGVYKDPQSVTIDGASGEAFYSVDANLGDTREVWFINKGLLYEVTTPKPLEAWFRDILGTWQFVE